MSQDFGDYLTTETVDIDLNAFDSNDPAASVTITDLAAGDIRIFKDGSLTQRTSANGVTIDIDFDANVGAHMVSIDLSDDTDAGFYIEGSRFQVMMVGTTVDAGTVTAWIGHFSIGLILRPTGIITSGSAAKVAAESYQFLQKPVVGFMASNPNPDDNIVFQEAKRPPVSSDAHGI